MTESPPKPYAQVAVNVPLRRLFDYRIPETHAPRVRVGVRVRVPFGRRTLTGYVVGLADETRVPEHQIREIISVRDKEPLLDDSMLALTRWIAEYYHCGWGEVLDAALPAGVRRKRTKKREVWFVALELPPEEARAHQDEIEKRSPAQARVVRTLLELGGQAWLADLKRQAKISFPSVRSLADKGVVALEKRTVDTADPLDIGPVEKITPPTLTPEQRRAFNLITARSDQGRFGVVLLHGVTSSGKTEVYLQAIARLVRGGRQAIVLVPEISLTPQTVRHFKSRFERLAVLHSRLTDAERKEQWHRIRAGEVDVVIGARSAVFAPVPELGMIVVDEEHENSFKQDATPRYNARDVAVVRARRAGALVVLGSATPALESHYNAIVGKYERVELKGRIGGWPLPPVEVVDMTHERPSGRRLSYISERLRAAMAVSLARDEQVILFINRRGFAPHVSCRRCGFVLRCDRCDVSVNYHRRYRKCICHQCGREFNPPQTCPECANPKLFFGGVGTERVEDDVRAFFPDKTCVRMDSDSMKARNALEEVLSAFRRHEIDILVGTQMIAKGLDFPRVTTVGVVWADTQLYIPDFRSRERTFQLVAQVAGRTGRGERGGVVIVQTSVPDDPAIRCAARHDYDSFARAELEERRRHGFPPFSRACRIVCHGRDEERVENQIEAIADVVSTTVEKLGEGTQIHGPAPAPLARVKLDYRFHLLITTPSPQSLRTILRAADSLLSRARGVVSTVDVDPMSML
jgi:primosomal protein N' (replication factor Y)